MEIIAIVIFFGFIGYLFIKVQKLSKKSQKRKPSEYTKLQAERSKVGGYKKRPLLNKTEQIAKKAIVSNLLKNQSFDKWDLLWQVSMGEFLAHSNYRLYSDINSKCVDFLIIDKFHQWPVAVIVIHGQGHYQPESDKAARATYSDKVKRNACESAGIKYIPIAVGSNSHSTEEEIGTVLSREVFASTD